MNQEVAEQKVINILTPLTNIEKVTISICINRIEIRHLQWFQEVCASDNLLTFYSMEDYYLNMPADRKLTDKELQIYTDMAYTYIDLLKNRNLILDELDKILKELVFEQV